LVYIYINKAVPPLLSIYCQLVSEGIVVLFRKRGGGGVRNSPPSWTLRGPLLCFEDATRSTRAEQIDSMGAHLPVISSWLGVDRSIITMLVRRRHRPASSRSGADVWHLGAWRLQGWAKRCKCTCCPFMLWKPVQTGGSTDKMRYHPQRWGEPATGHPCPCPPPAVGSFLYVWSIDITGRARILTLGVCCSRPTRRIPHRAVLKLTTIRPLCLVPFGLIYKTNYPCLVSRERSPCKQGWPAQR
jgi:hypothetical protein